MLACFIEVPGNRVPLTVSKGKVEVFRYDVKIRWERDLVTVEKKEWRRSDGGIVVVAVLELDELDE